MATVGDDEWRNVVFGQVVGLYAFVVILISMGGEQEEGPVKC